MVRDMSPYLRPRQLSALAVSSLALSLAACGNQPPTSPPPAQVASVVVAPVVDSVMVGSTLQLTATAKDAAGNSLAGRPVTWASSNTARAMVSSAGLVTARAPGPVSITASVEGVNGTATITVLALAARVVVTPESTSIAQGGSLQLTALVEDASGSPLPGRTIAWSSSDSTKLTVTRSGLATALSAADVIVTARSGGASGTAAVGIIGPAHSVLVLPRAASLVIGDSVQLTAVTTDVAGHVINQPVTWSAPEYKVLVSASGMVQAVAAGSAGVHATAQGATVSYPAAITVTMDSLLSAVAATTGRTCALSARGTVYCWGGIAFPVPGITDGPETAIIRTAVRLPTALSAARLVAAPVHTCLLTEAGSAYCWGSNDSGQLGNDTVTTICSAGYVCSWLPVPVLGGLSFNTIAGGDYGTCGITTSQLAYCWGENAHGEVGDGSTILRPTPVPVSGGLSFRSIAVGREHACGVTTDSLAYCWGNNGDGQLGIGAADATPHTTPQPVVGGLHLTAISTGAFHTCAVTAGGAAYCWGRNTSGQVGTTTCGAPPCSTPTSVDGGVSFSQVSAGQWHTCGLTDQGDAYCWGLGTSYQLGNGSDGSQASPGIVLGTIKWAFITAAEQHTCGLSIGLVAYCWGGNGYGQLGTGSSADAITPVRVVGQP
jgi:alpha-tubulin suppressor-like RCC1 family protein/predicted small lipoprotein YifL